MLLGMDATTDAERIWNSYHDPGGLFGRFMRGGLEHANRVLGAAWYRPEDWEVVGVMSGEYVMHRFVFRARRDVRCEAPGGVTIEFPEGHEIDCYEGFKYQPEEMARQFEAAGLKQLGMWKAPEPSGICELSWFLVQCSHCDGMAPHVTDKMALTDEYLLCKETTSKTENGGE